MSREGGIWAHVSPLDERVSLVWDGSIEKEGVFGSPSSLARRAPRMGGRAEGPSGPGARGGGPTEEPCAGEPRRRGGAGVERGAGGVARGRTSAVLPLQLLGTEMGYFGRVVARLGRHGGAGPRRRPPTAARSGWEETRTAAASPKPSRGRRRGSFRPGVDGGADDEYPRGVVTMFDTTAWSCSTPEESNDMLASTRRHGHPRPSRCGWMLGNEVTHQRLRSTLSEVEAASWRPPRGEGWRVPPGGPRRTQLLLGSRRVEPATGARRRPAYEEANANANGDRRSRSSHR